jgi:hypothetical protein
MTTITKPVTEKQIAYISTLLNNICGDNAGEFMLAFMESEPTTKDASAYIDTLKAKSKPAPVEVNEDAIPDGLHYIGQQVYRIRESKSSGRLYAELLDTAAREFRYVGRKPLAQANAETLMTLEQAKVFGKAYGFCVRCCALLEDPASVEAGVGPVCAKKF